MNSSGRLSAAKGMIGLPNQVAQSSNCKLRGQSCYLEVTIGCSSTEDDKLQYSSNKNISRHQFGESPAVAKDAQKKSARRFSVCERTFIYPAEAVIVPVVQTSFARSSLKR